MAHGARAIKLLRALVFPVVAGFVLDCGADVFVRDDIAADPDPALFNICYDHGCTSLAWVKLSAEQWEQVRLAFARPAATAAEERAQIGAGIALFERIVGALTGTAGDKGEPPFVLPLAAWKSGWKPPQGEALNTEIRPRPGEEGQ